MWEDLQVEQALDTMLFARNSEGFLAGMGQGCAALYECLTRNRKSSGFAEKTLSRAFAKFRDNLPRRRALELCAWPVLDKPRLPSAGAAEAEFLWLFTVPFIIRFAATQPTAPLMLAESFDVDQLLATIESYSGLNDRAQLRAFSTLFRREDFHLFGPQNVVDFFVSAEQGALPGLSTPPLDLPGAETGVRTMALFVPCAARLSVGETYVFKPRDDWPAQSLAAVMYAGLMHQSIRVSSVVALPPCSMGEALFRCQGPGGIELHAVLEDTKAAWPNAEVLLKFTGQGYLELIARVGDGGAEREIALMPAFPAVEPKNEWTQRIQRHCAALGLEFGGSYSLAFHSGALLH